MKSKRKKAAKKQVANAPRISKWKLIAGFFVLCLLLSMCSGGGNKNKDDESKPVDEEQAVAEQVEEQAEEQEEEQVEEPVDYAQLFIDQYNANCTTPPITAVESFIPKDSGPYYRVEFRLGAYRDCAGTHCRIGDNDINDGSIDIVTWPDRAHYRVYVVGNKETFAAAFIDTIKLLHPSAFSDEFLSKLKDELVNGHSGYYDLERMIEDENFDMYGKVICGTSEFASAYDDSVSSGIVEGSIALDD